jgi:Domain of unknown function (DUF4177)
MSERWEYKSVKLNTTGWLAGGVLDTPAFDTMLNELGAKGWELVSAFDTNQAYGASREVVAVFKRSLPLSNAIPGSG